MVDKPAADADVAVIRDQHGEIHGFWLAKTEAAQNRDLLGMLIVRFQGPPELTEAVVMGDYRIAPNTSDDTGGCFVMFGSAPAPGEDLPQKKKFFVPSEATEGGFACPQCSAFIAYASGTIIKRSRTSHGSLFELAVACPQCGYRAVAYVGKTKLPKSLKSLAWRAGCFSVLVGLVFACTLLCVIAMN